MSDLPDPDEIPDLPQLDKSVAKGARQRVSWRCRECVRVFQQTRVYRQCAFHPMTHTFSPLAKGCASMSKLRWILRANGVQVVHPELAGSVQWWTMGLGDGRRLVMVWISGFTRTTAAMVVSDNQVAALDAETANMVLDQYRPEADDGAYELSVEWTR